MDAPHRGRDHAFFGGVGRAVSLQLYGEERYIESIVACRRLVVLADVI
jgi:hypothetical protein